MSDPNEPVVPEMTPHMEPSPHLQTSSATVDGAEQASDVHSHSVVQEDVEIRSKRVRAFVPIALIVLLVAGVVVFVLHSVSVVRAEPVATVSATTVSSSQSVEQAVNRASTNNLTADSAVKQQVVNGWETIDLQAVAIARLDDTANASLATRAEVEALRLQSGQTNDLMRLSTIVGLVLIGLLTLQIVISTLPVLRRTSPTVPGSHLRLSSRVTSPSSTIR